MFNVNDFVILLETMAEIEKNAVGLIQNKINENNFIVFFIGKNTTIQVGSNHIQLLDVTKTGKPHKYKICNMCHVLKEDFVDFEINQTDAKGTKTTRPSCKMCRIGIDGVKIIPSEKKRMQKIKPDKIFVCPICNKSSIPSITANIVIDHDHSTGLARAWLCDSCNTGLGRFKDSIELLEKAIIYLKQFENSK